MQDVRDVGGRGLRCVGGCKPGEGGREGHERLRRI